MDLKGNWIWRKKTVNPYNDIIIAKKEFNIDKTAEKAFVSVTADSIYRISINGQWVCDGPARGWPEHYYYDKVDIVEHFKAGINEVKIIACYYGIGHFHGRPQQPGLLAQIDISYSDGSNDTIATDSTWQVAKAQGWYTETPKISRQMGPAEYYQASFEDSLDFANAEVICGAHDGPWKDLTHRDVKMLTRKPVQFSKFMQANVLAKCDTQNFCIYWAKLLYPNLIQANGKLVPAFALAVVIDVDRAINFSIAINEDPQTDFGVFVDGNAVKSTVLINAGRHLLFISSGSRGHYTDTTISLSADGKFKLTNPYNDSSDNALAMLGYEEFKYADTDLIWAKCSKELQACRDGYRLEMEALSKIGEIDQFVSRTSDKVLKLTAEQMFSKDCEYRFLGRQKIGDGLDRVDNPEGILAGKDGVVTVLPAKEGDIELVYDLGMQDIGYYSFELETPQGVEFDIYSVEYISPDGKIQYPNYHRNGMTYITKAGLNKFISLKRRSGRYIFLRFSNQKFSIKLKSFKLIESTYPVEHKGYFKCSDQNLNKIWGISAHTLKLCMEDTFTDCPLYEQTLWVGDARNESIFAYGVFGAGDIAKRCIKLAAQSLECYPIVGCQVPSSWDCLLPAWSFLWGISVWDYYWYTKDEKFLAQIWPYVVKNLKGAQGYINEIGLFSGDFWNFFDWAGIDHSHKTVLHNSMIMVGAIDAAIKSGRVLGKKCELDWLEQLGSQLRTSINRFWQDTKKAYPDSIHEDGKISSSVSQHTSFLALLYDIAEPETVNSLLSNVVFPSEQTVKVGSPFAIFYMYEMLDKFGRNDLIMKSIYDSYLPMVKVDASTVWESFYSGADILGYDGFPTRSHCHAWSSAPLYFLHRIILGIKQKSPGCESFDISPYVTDLDWAEGAFATPLGKVNVNWQKSGNRLDIRVCAPKEIEIEFKENESLSSFDVFFDKTIK